MGQFTLKYDSAEVEALLEGFRVSGKYQDTIADPDNEGGTVPNPETIAVFSKKMLLSYLKKIHEIGVVSLANVESAKKVAKENAKTRSAMFDVV